MKARELSNFNFGEGVVVGEDTIKRWEREIITEFENDPELKEKSNRMGNAMVFGRKDSENHIELFIIRNYTCKTYELESD